MNEIEKLIKEFIQKLTQAVSAETRNKVLIALGGSTSKFVSQGLSITLADGSSRRKGPIQLCPVPGCKNRAAPVFNMVCAKHKNLPKATIKKHREARRARARKAR